MAGSLAKALLVSFFLLALASISGCALRKPPDLVPAAELRWQSADGWHGTVRHYPGEGPPVLLVHGMGANHYNWDYRAEVSFAAWLAARGWDVWVPTLRGERGTSPPDRKTGKSWSFDQHALLDLPAVLDVVREATGEPQVLWVGHSMGGMLLYAALSRYPERVRAGVAIASPARFTALSPLKRALRRGGRLVGSRGRLQLDELVTLASPLGRYAPGLSRISLRQNMDPALARGLLVHGIEDLPRAMVQQVVTWLRAGELVMADGRTPWLTPPATPVPLLVLAGDRDWIAPAEDVTWACAVLPACEARVLGPESGMPRSYGHVDMVVGRDAAAEVYPELERWLRARLEPTAPSSPATAP